MCSLYYSIIFSKFYLFSSIYLLSKTSSFELSRFSSFFNSSLISSPLLYYTILFSNSYRYFLLSSIYYYSSSWLLKLISNDSSICSFSFYLSAFYSLCDLCFSECLSLCFLCFLSWDVVLDLFLLCDLDLFLLWDLDLDLYFFYFCLCLFFSGVREREFFLFLSFLSFLCLSLELFLGFNYDIYSIFISPSSIIETNFKIF